MTEWSNFFSDAAVQFVWVHIFSLIFRILLELWLARSPDKSLGQLLRRTSGKLLRCVSTKRSTITLPAGPIGSLPIEMILCIADHLESEHRVSLSLTCKHFNCILRGSSLNLSLNVTAQVNLMQLLERDHPEYLTCRQCGKAFLWRKRQHGGYRCPHRWRTPQHYRRSLGRMLCLEHGIYISDEITDLISRGPRDGLHITSLNFRGTTFRQIPGSSEARWVNGQILIAFKWVWEFKSRQDVKDHDRIHNSSIRWQDQLTTSICAHHYFDWGYKTERALSSADANLPMNEGKQKCTSCDTDYRVDIRSFDDGHVRVQLEAWSNLGSRDHRSLATDQYYISWPTTRLDDEALARRDLESLFATGESTHAACQH